MNDDLELLKAAAKVAGIPIFEWVHSERTDSWLGARADSEEAAVYWDPLNDDGDALRLAVKLGIDFYEGDDDGRATYAGYYTPSGNTRRQRLMVERHDAHGDPYSAARRAIVRAAAAMAAGA